MSAPEIARALGLKRVGRDWRGDCPACGYADTFCVSHKDGRDLWWCASCQNRDAVTAAVRSAIGGDWSPPAAPAAPAPDNASRTRAALVDWDESIPIAGTIAELYLTARGLAGETSAALRFHSSLRHPHETASFPCLVGLVVNTETGEPVAIHRVYLRRDGSGKAAIDPQKASKGPIRGGAIMLHAPVPGRPLVIAEGIETALSAGRIMSAPAWAATAAGNIQRVTLPAAPSVIIIAADPDPTGQREAWAAAALWKAQGHAVRVATPDTTDTDFNDLLRARMAREATHG
jgi:phage/plasmid primase-like uncharacterized protein